MTLDALHPPTGFGDLAGAWSWQPGVVVPLAVSGALYAAGVARLWRAAGSGRGVRTWEAAAFAAGWYALALALVSPLHAWGEALFAAHMVQHEALMLVAAPLLALGRPLVAFAWALPIAWRRRAGAWTKARAWRAVWNPVSSPLGATAIHAAALWVWHAPRLFDAAVLDERVHALQHASFFLSALLFWHAIARARRAVLGASTLYVFATSVHSGGLGALLSVASRPLYSAYVATAASWGLTPLEDQQIGGLVMWVPAGTVYVVAGLALFAGWLREAGRRAERRERAALAGGRA